MSGVHTGLPLHWTESIRAETSKRLTNDKIGCKKQLEIYIILFAARFSIDNDTISPSVVSQDAFFGFGTNEIACGRLLQSK